MASRKAKTETLRSSVSEVRVKSAVVKADTDSQAKGLVLNHYVKQLCNK